MGNQREKTFNLRYEHTTFICKEDKTEFKLNLTRIIQDLLFSAKDTNAQLHPIEVY